MADATVVLNVGYTDVLTFTNAEGQTVPPPAGGSVTLSTPANGTIGLSAAGDAINATLTVAGPVTYNYSVTNQNGQVLTLTGTLTGGADVVATAVTESGWKAGTTA